MASNIVIEFENVIVKLLIEMLIFIVDTLWNLCTGQERPNTTYFYLI